MQLVTIHSSSLQNAWILFLYNTCCCHAFCVFNKFCCVCVFLFFLLLLFCCCFIFIFLCVCVQSMVCQMRDPQDLPVNQVLSVTVRVGQFSSTVGQIRINPGLELIIYLVPALAFIIILCVVIFIVLFAVFYRKARQKDERYDQLMVELEKLESSVARECKLGESWA